MRQNISKFVYWTPRILGIVFVCFLTLFSLDIFEMKLNFWNTVVGLFMHNIPAMILIVVLIISWKYEIVGGIVFILAGFAYIIMTIMGDVPWYLALSWSLTIAGPAFLIGVLFIIGWNKKRKIQ